MNTIKKGMSSIDVLSLQCSLPNLTLDGVFGDKTELEVKKYQESLGLVPDGIVGPKTWEIIIKELGRGKISENDWDEISNNLGVEKAMLKAIHEVETSGASYLASGYPALLFEAHIFYSQLSKAGLNPESYIKSHPGILSKSWNKSLYKGGIGEVPRINEAWSIAPNLALNSASFGAFQICGFNYKSCGVSNVFEFYKEMWKSETGQLKLLAGFLKGSGIVPYMKTKNFKEIARRYNGSGYAKNKYDVKLEKSYNKYV